MGVTSAFFISCGKTLPFIHALNILHTIGDISWDTCISRLPGIASGPVGLNMFNELNFFATVAIVIS